MSRRTFILQLGFLAVVAAGPECRFVPAARLRAQDPGYQQTTWREWPGEPRPDKTFPLAIGAEVLPTPPGQEEVPPPRGMLVPTPAARVPDGVEELPSTRQLPSPFQEEGPTVPMPGDLPAPEKPVPGLLLPEPAPAEAPSRKERIRPMAGPKLAETTSVPQDSGTATWENSGLLTVFVPCAAKLTINGMPTCAKGSQRRFVSYGLKPGLRYKYEVRAAIVRDERVVEETQTFALEAGELAGAAFGFNVSALADAADERTLPIAPPGDLLPDRDLPIPPAPTEKPSLPEPGLGLPGLLPRPSTLPQPELLPEVPEPSVPGLRGPAPDLVPEMPRKPAPR